jgi:hypothetical protein
MSIPNQIFIGCPWRGILPKYEAVLPDLRKKYPISFVIVGRRGGQDAKDLFDVIKQNILASSFAVFDGTGGNANVSLEYGFAEAHGHPRALYSCTHKATKAAAKQETAIISDLAGKTRNHYSQNSRLKSLLSGLCKDHDYTKRFEKFLVTKFKKKTKGQKKRARALALKIIHQMDGHPSLSRGDAVYAMTLLKYKAGEINEMLTRLHNAKLINCSVGNASQITIV